MCEFQRGTFPGNDAVFGFIRISEEHDWEMTLAIDACSFKAIFEGSFHTFSKLLDVSDFVKVYRTSFPVGDGLMWSALIHNRADVALRLPVLHTLRPVRLVERECQRQLQWESH